MNEYLYDTCTNSCILPFDPELHIHVHYPIVDVRSRSDCIKCVMKFWELYCHLCSQPECDENMNENAQ